MGWDEWSVMERLLVIFVGWLVAAVLVLMFERREIKKHEEILKNDIEMYKYFLNKQRSSKVQTKIVYRDVPNGTLEAVKYAVKHSHPDSGGNEQDFIKFKKCYEALKNGKKA